MLPTCSLLTEIDYPLDEKLHITDTDVTFDFNRDSQTVSQEWKSDKRANLKNRVSTIKI